MTLQERLALHAAQLAMGLDPLLELDEVLAITKLSRSEMYARAAADRFPKPVKLGRRSVWLLSAIKAWLAAETLPAPAAAPAPAVTPMAQPAPVRRGRPPKQRPAALAA